MTPEEIRAELDELRRINAENGTPVVDLRAQRRASARNDCEDRVSYQRARAVALAHRQAGVLGDGETPQEVLARFEARVQSADSWAAAQLGRVSTMSEDEAVAAMQNGSMYPVLAQDGSIVCGDRGGAS